MNIYYIYIFVIYLKENVVSAKKYNLYNYQNFDTFHFAKILFSVCRKQFERLKRDKSC